MWSLYTCLRLAIPCIAVVVSSQPYADDDLMSFVSEPMLRAPILNITKHDLNRTTQGCWFVAPYANLLQRPEEKLHVPAQTGPHIYSTDGTLIWSGAQLYPSRSILDFRLTTYNGSPALSFIVVESPRSEDYPLGAGIVLDNTYSPITAISTPPKDTKFDVHEFIVKDESAVYIYHISVNPLESEGGNFNDDGFVEVHIPTGEVTFNWEASQHISRHSSSKPEPEGRGMWDWLHMNSIERDSTGDFIISARHTDAVYKISRTNGSVMWQLGGADSTYAMEDFAFYRQHDARVFYENETTTILSLLNNGADPSIKITETSAFLIALDHPSRSARLLMRWDRPDGGSSTERGNVQMLPDTNVFVGWSGKDGYMSEHSASGDVLMEARFASTRMSTYRAYKYFNYTGIPASPPSLKAQAFQTSETTATTVFYVSWNGATEVRSWNFYVSYLESGPFELAGSAVKTGFETVYACPRSAKYAFAEAIGADAASLRDSTVQSVEAVYRTGSLDPSRLLERPGEAEPEAAAHQGPSREPVWGMSHVLYVLVVLIAFAAGWASRRFHRCIRRCSKPLTL